MYLEFMSKDHEGNFYDLLVGAGTTLDDSDRTALFYIISGSPGLYSKVYALYDYKKQMIHDDWQERADFSGGLRGLVSLAFNLYNGYEANPYNLFSNLDSYHRELAHRAIRVRFPYENKK